MVAKNNKHLLAHSFCESGIQKRLSWVVLRRIQSGCWPLLQSSKDLPTAKGPASRIAHVALGRRSQFLGAGWRSLFNIRQLGSSKPLIQERGQNGQQTESHSAIYDLVLEVARIIAVVFHGHMDQPSMI